MDSEDASEATEVTTARGRRRGGAREMIVPEKKMMLPPPSVAAFQAGRAAAKWVGVPGIGGR